MSTKGEETKSSSTNQHSHEKEDDKLIVTRRDEAPSHYILEIESVKKFEEILSKTCNGLDRYESTEFEASGYKWRLIVYPQGNKQRNGDAHISLYLEILDIQEAGGIDAHLNFFVYDYNKNQYVSFQDGRMKRFTEVNTELGFSRLLSLTEFKNNSNGYLSSDDRCKFGVEVFVINRNSEGECFSFIDKPHNNQFSWKIQNPKDASCYSDDFVIEGFKWKLHVYPKGVSKVKGIYLSVFLRLQDHQKIPQGTKMYVEFKIGINVPIKDIKRKKPGSAWFSSTETAWGFPRFIKLADLPLYRDEIIDDVLVEAEISSMSMTKDL